MKTAKLGFNRLADAVKIDTAFQVVEQMTGNDNFRDPKPTLEEVSGAATNMQTAYNNAKQRVGANAQQRLEEARKNLSVVMEELRRYVNWVAKGNEVIIRSSGMHVSKTPAPVARPLPVSLYAEFSNVSGTILLKWKASKHAKSYMVWYTATPDDESSWKFVDTVSEKQILVGSLSTGQRYWFRVVAVGTNGNSIPCDPATMIAA